MHAGALAFLLVRALRVCLGQLLIDLGAACARWWLPEQVKEAYRGTEQVLTKPFACHRSNTHVSDNLVVSHLELVQGR